LLPPPEPYAESFILTPARDQRTILRMKPALRGLASLILLPASLLVASAFAQNPVPQIVGPVHPDAVAPGGGDFTLNVYGANFVPGAVVNWNYHPRATTYVSGHELQAQILSMDIAKNTAGYISVTNPAPGGGSSSASWAQVEVHSPMSTIVVNPSAYYLFGFWQMQAADFNHDAILDLVGEYWGLGLDLGMGNGTFRAASVVDRNNLSPFQFGYGDFNGDGNPDVASLSYLDSGGGFIPTRMSAMLGDGKGNFTRGPSLDSRWDDLGDVTVGDFNQDGKLDLVTKGGGTLSTYLGNGDGSFKHAAHYAYPAQGLGAQMLAGDFNGDGKLDLILEQATNINHVPAIALWFLQGKGDGTFQRPKKIASFPSTQVCLAFSPIMQLSDFNGDGKLDLAFCSQSQIGVMLGNGDGTFRPANFYTADTTGLGQFTFAIGDINSDGKPDLLVSEYSTFSNPQFVTFMGNGDGTFQAPQTISLTQVPPPELGIVVGDFTSNGLLGFISLSDLGMDVFTQP
jgi:FG-GAP-like repeat